MHTANALNAYEDVNVMFRHMPSSGCVELFGSGRSTMQHVDSARKHYVHVLPNCPGTLLGFSVLRARNYVAVSEKWGGALRRNSP